MDALPDLAASPRHDVCGPFSPASPWPRRLRPRHPEPGHGRSCHRAWRGCRRELPCIPDRHHSRDARRLLQRQGRRAHLADHHLILVVLIGRGLFNIILAIALTGWLGMARLVRGQTLSIREREYVEAARTIGTPNAMILSRHILPNALGPIIVQATYLVPAAIIFEAFLSLLGLGIPPPSPSWGAMASEGYKALQIAPHIVLAPCAALSLTVLAFNWLGDGLRDAIDPRMRR
ncbi:MAG: ABC transporter permease [Chloroflexi bacterium]|nr:MAG: ABC transporter permease [Chloroflexota bacterium]